MKGHMAKSAKFTVAIFLVAFSAGCASMDQYKAVGFDSPLQLFQYAEYTQYYGMRLNADDWRTFCERFPDLLAGGNCTTAPLINPDLNILAYHWTMQQRKDKWDAATLERLAAKDIRPGDSIYHINWAWGPPQRIIWDHNAEVILYDDTAYIMGQSLVKERKECPRCSWHDPGRDKDDEDRDIIKKLGLERSEH